MQKSEEGSFLKNKAKKSYKEELRSSLIKNSLLHILIICVFCVVLIFSFLAVNMRSTVVGDGNDSSGVLKNVINTYSDVLLEEYEESYFYDLQMDREFLSQEYKRFLQITDNAEISANFYMFDANFNVVLQSQYPADYELSTQQRTKEWTTFGMIWSYPDEVIVEISNEFLGEYKYNDLVIGKAIKSGDEIIGYIVFCIEEAELIEKFSAVYSSDIIIMNKNNSVLASTNISFEDLVKQSVADDGKIIYLDKTLIYKSSILDGDFQVYALSDISIFGIALVVALVSIMLFLSVIIFVMIRVSNKFSIQKTQYIDEILETFKHVENGRLDKHMREFDIMEFDEISQAYNKMIDDIQQLMEINEKKTYENFISEIKQLELQFNSHFLFNSLENIRFMIAIAPKKAMECIVNLAGMLRYSIETNVRYVSVEEDLFQVQRYLEIIKLRFGERLNYSINISKYAKSILIPKLIIQPIIENAVKYAYGEKEKLFIDISVKTKRGDLVITVKDDGVGMNKEELFAIRENLTQDENKSKHIGLFNVHRRLQLICGESYGLTISSVKDKGTVVELNCRSLEGIDD